MTQKDIYTIEDVLSKSRTYIQSEKSLDICYNMTAKEVYNYGL